MKTRNKSESIGDLATEVVTLGRLVAEQASTLSLGRCANDAAVVTRCLASLAERQPFAEADDAGLEAVWRILLADLTAEIVEFEQRYVETHYDAMGQHGEVREVPVYSDRGAELLKLERIFSRLLEARHAVFDHVAAHRALLTLMAG